MSDTKTEVVENRTTLKAICDELGLNSATARRKLRTKFQKGSEFRWDFNDAEKAQVIEILTAKPVVAEKTEKVAKSKKSKKSKKTEEVVAEAA